MHVLQIMYIFRQKSLFTHMQDLFSTVCFYSMYDSRKRFVLSNIALDFQYGIREKKSFVCFLSLSHLALDSNDILTLMFLQIIYIF